MMEFRLRKILQHRAGEESGLVGSTCSRSLCTWKIHADDKIKKHRSNYCARCPSWTVCRRCRNDAANTCRFGFSWTLHCRHPHT